MGQVIFSSAACEPLEKFKSCYDAVDWMWWRETRESVWTAMRMGLWDMKVDQVWEFVLRRYTSEVLSGYSSQ